MKKLIFFVAGLLMLSACKKDEIVSDSGASEEVVTISAQLPEELASRAVGDGSAVNRCILEIYDADGNLKGDRQVVSISTSSKANFTATLTSGETYQVVLWADYSDNNADVYYDTDSEGGLKNISRITDTYVGNNDQLDAFFASETFTASENSTSVVLKRPFAQLNIFATDYTALQDADKPDQVLITFDAVYTSFNALEGSVGGEQQLAYTAPVAIADVATGQMSYDYLFASVDQANLNDFTMSFYKDGSEVSSAYEFTNIPVKRNYRTNVKGNLLTVGTTVEVTIIPEFAQPDDEISLYDGTPVKPEVTEGTYAIKSAANLAYFMQNLTEFNGSTIDIQCNMDFDGATIQSVVTGTQSFHLDVNGNGKTISNLVLNGGNSIGGFIPEMGSGTIKDLTFDNLTVKVDTELDAYVGGIVGRVFGNLVVTNCNVLNSTITGGVNKIGGIVGFVTGDASNIEITSCRVENTTVEGESRVFNPGEPAKGAEAGDCGGIVGYIQSPSATITGNYVLNSTLSLTNVYNTDKQIVGRGMSLYVGTCSVVKGANIVISADADATQGSKRVIDGSEDGGLVRYQGLLGNIRSMNLPSDATLTINGIKVEKVDISTEKNSVE